jgi:predicted dehydrogenase
VSRPAPLRVAVAGLGYFSQFHLAAWQRVDDVALAAVCDPDAAKTEAVAGRTGAAGFTDFSDMLEACQPDIVDIVAPPPAHAALIRKAALPGRTIICQKPFCRSLAEAREITAEAARVGALLVVHENFRFQPWHRQLKQFLDEGGLGEVYQCQFALRPGDGRGPDAYLQRQPTFQTMPRFLVHETAVHLIDVFRWLFGPIESVYADLRQLNPVIAGEDAGLLVLAHHGGVRSVFDGNRLSDHVADNPRTTMGEMLVEGEKGTVRLDGFGRLHFRGFGERESIEIPIRRPVDMATFGGGCVEALIRHVVDGVLTGAPIENSAEYYLDVIALVDAAYASAASGRKMRVEA